VVVGGSCIVVIPHCCSVVVLYLIEMGWDEHGTGYLPWSLKIDNNDKCHLSSIGGHVTVSDVAPGFCVSKISDDREVSLPCPGHINYLATMNFSHCLPFGCHVAISNVASGFHVREISLGWR